MAALFSMKFPYLFLAAGVLAVPAVRAVYAPVPAEQQGRPLVVSVRGGVSYDSNIFGSASGEIESLVYNLTPSVAWNGSLTDQTFASVSYQLSLDHIDRRPGDKTLDSHDFRGRIAHSFSPATTIDVSDTFSSTRNPESSLAGIPINTDQSNNRNQLDARFATAPAPKAGLVLKARSLYYDYRNAALGRSLDRTENLFGISGDFALLPETKLVAEYRHQIIDYRVAGATKDKRSDFFMAGADYAAGRKTTATARFGVERRDRSAERSSTVPYVELSAKYDYGASAFISGGYIFSLEESSDTARFTDTEVNRFFVNLQHPLTAGISATAAVVFEPSQLQGRRGQRDVDETSVRAGVGLHYKATKNWSVSATYDYDHVSSDDFFRKLERHRVGVNAAFAF